MKFLYTLLFLVVANPAFGSECFELSEDGKTWDPKPFTLCVERNTGGTSEYKITLSKDNKDFAIYYLNSLPTMANAMAFGVNPMSGSYVDDSLTIVIGYGEVRIGGGKYYYQE